MRTFSMKKIKLILVSCLMALAAFFGATLLNINAKTASADVSLNSDTYKTLGGSVRLFDKEGDVLDQRKGIRFHILLEKSLYEEYSADADFVSYTVVLPKSILGTSELGYDTPKAVKINTTEYWEEYTEDNSFMESIAYIYDLPETKHATDLCFRGIFSTDGGATWHATDVGVKSMAYVAKAARDDVNETWNSTQLSALNYYIPQYTFTYKVDETKTSETVEYGDVLNIPTLQENASWWHEEGNGEIAPPTTATFENTEGVNTTKIQLTSTTTTNFVLSGVEYTANGFNVFATLSATKFADGTVLNPEHIDMVKEDGTPITATSVSVLVAGTGDNAKSRIAISFDYSKIANGDKLTILKSSQFYYNGSLYKLGKDYTFEYHNQNWELPLGEISVGDIEEIRNYTEVSGANTEYNIRVFFRNDFLINGSATLQKADDCTKESSVYVTRVGGEVDYIKGGYYYWNQGSVKILELPETNDIWGKDDGDVLTIEAGTKLVQNNGYYVFKDTITVTYNGGTKWFTEYTEHDLIADDFVGATTRYEDGKYYIDVTTKTKWADQTIRVVFNGGELTYHNTDNVTTSVPLVYYHGEEDYQLLRIYIDQMSVTGDWVTIPEGTEFWVGNNVYRLGRDLISYYVYENIAKAGQWITNPVINDVSATEISSATFNTDDHGATYSIRYKTKTAWSDYGWNRVEMDDTYIDGDGVICTGTNYSSFYYHGGSNQLLEIQGVDFGSAGGSVTLKAGTIFWLFRNDTGKFMSAYRLTSDITINVSGANGSTISKEDLLANITKENVTSIGNDDSHGKEIRFTLDETKVSGIYGYANIEGSVTLNGKPTTLAWIYGGDGTSGYNGKTIIAFTGDGFGGNAFQASAKGDKVVIAAGTKLVTNSGYILIEDEWTYVYDGAEYKDGDKTYTVSFNATNSTVTVNGNVVSNVAVMIGDRVTFNIQLEDGASLISVTNATKNADGSYTTDYIFGGTTVNVVCDEPIRLTQSSIASMQTFHEGAKWSLRLHLEQTDEIKAIEGGHYGVVFDGNVSLTLGGVAMSPTEYNYHGSINGTSHQILEVMCTDLENFKVGDALIIHAGSTIALPKANVVFYIAEDIKVGTVGFTANFDSNKVAVYISGQRLNSGETIGLWVDEYVFTAETLDKTLYEVVSVKVNQVEQGTVGRYTINLLNDTIVDISAINKCLVSWTNPTGATLTVKANGSTITSGMGVSPGTQITVTATPAEHFDVTGITANGSSIGTTSGTCTVNSNTTIVATTKEHAKYKVSWTNPANGTISVTDADGKAVSNGGSVYKGTEITVSVSVQENYKLSNLTVGDDNQFENNGKYTVNSDTTITATTENCIVEGTLITLADGTRKAVEDLTGDELLLVWNLETGMYDVAPIVFVDADKEYEYEVVNLYFSNGAEVGIVAEHGFFDVELGEYVYLNASNAMDYIGHRFITQGDIAHNTWDTIILTNVVVERKVVRTYSPVTFSHLCYYVDGVLSMPGGISGLFNIFEVDVNTMRYDAEKMAKDIETYGLFTYEDFGGMIPMEAYEAFNGAWLKVAMGKGMIDWNIIERYAAKYIPLM